MSDEVAMSSTTRNILKQVGRMIPPMLSRFHKGQLGRVGVIGGSEDYTGAPFFSAMASARLGCDMSHVICTPGAAAVIKTYSPNLMVHPLMRQTKASAKITEKMAEKNQGDAEGNPDAGQVAEKVIAMLPRLHVLVVGPGLGRDPVMQETVALVIRAARDADLPVVLDADALQVVQRQPELVRGYGQAVLTPNVVEFERLCEALGIADDNGGGPAEEPGRTRRVEKLARALGGVTVVAKGERDVISNGRTTLVDDLPGGLKRSGGQGDTLTGAIATFLGWRKAYLDRLWEGEGEGERLDGEETMGLAVFGGSAITRECSRLAFMKKGRSLQASDLTEEIHDAFMRLFGEESKL